jgi:hypothetical protein
MKTILSLKALIVITFLIVAIISCKKDSLSATSAILPGNLSSSTQTAASLSDNGIVNNETRQMIVTLKTQNFSVSDSINQVLGDAADINVALYSDADGIVPSGSYSFSSGDAKEPFTFDTGVISAQVSPNSNSPDQFGIVDGTIVVTQNNSIYDLNFQLQLTSGKTFAGSYNGIVVYKDALKK